MQLAGRPLTVPPSSRRASPADSALWKKEKGREQFHKHFWLLRDGGCWTLLEALQTHLSYLGFAPCPQRGTGDRCSLNNLVQNRLHRYQMMPVWLLESSAAQLCPPDLRRQASPRQGELLSDEPLSPRRRAKRMQMKGIQVRDSLWPVSLFHTKISSSLLSSRSLIRGLFSSP